ncbi:MAG: HAD family phosphatase [Bacteroidales bacterium]|nr:HAD family phosphatase [Bacteroidales bacterium]
MNFGHKKAILWDNDGVLVDTEKYFFKATKEILKKAGIDLTTDLFIEYALIKGIGPWHLLEEKGFDGRAVSVLRAERDDLYNQYLEKYDLTIDGVEETLKSLSGKFLMGIVTSSKPHHFKTIHRHGHILKYIDFVVTPNDYTKYKPDPEPYITGWKKTNQSRQSCVVIEDSRRGLLSAKAAGLDCIIIPNELTKTSGFSEANLVIDSITQLPNILCKFY